MLRPCETNFVLVRLQRVEHRPREIGRLNLALGQIGKIARFEDYKFFWRYSKRPSFSYILKFGQIMFNELI
jgi:hypothetical protein